MPQPDIVERVRRMSTHDLAPFLQSLTEADLDLLFDQMPSASEEDSFRRSLVQSERGLRQWMRAQPTPDAVDVEAADAPEPPGS